MPRLFLMTEHSPFMMGFVFITDRDRAVVIDGGRPADMEHLYSLVGDREIAAWVLTHPHFDHISGFNRMMLDEKRRAQVKNVYYNFPSVDFVLSCEPQFQSEEEPCSVRDFEELLPLLGEKAVRVSPGMRVQADELTLSFLFCGGERFRLPKPNLAVNESSLVCRVTAPGMKSVLFLGDLGPEGGRELLRLCPDALPSEIVQMAHHGHSGVSEEVYRKIRPEACIWCAPLWLYEEADIEFEPELWGTVHQRKWMENLGVRTHYVSGMGTQEISLF